MKGNLALIANRRIMISLMIICSLLCLKRIQIIGKINRILENMLNSIMFPPIIIKTCLLKTIVSDGNDLDGNALEIDLDRTALLKIEYLKDKSFIDYLNQVKNAFGDAEEHAEKDAESHIGEDLSHYSIYDLSKLEPLPVESVEGSAFTLNIHEDYLDLIYNSDLFEDVYINHMADNIGSLINEVLSNPLCQCKFIDILSDDEKDLLSSFSKGKAIEVDKDKTFAMSFRENALKYPDLMAIDDGVNQVSYSQLESSSNSIAYVLSNDYGIGFGDCIGLMLPRTYHFPEIVLSLNKIGALFTPIDPNYPLKRVGHILNISDSRHIVTTKEYAQSIDLNVDVICIEDLNKQIRSENDLLSDETVECLGNGDDLFAIFFTSGTTGLPKGVMVSNKQIKSVAVAFKDSFKTSADELIGYFASFSFIASVRLFIALIFGESCRIFNEIEQKDSLLLIKALKEHEMNDLILPPSLGIPIFENEDMRLKYLILAGARLNELGNNKSNTCLSNFYGTTELIMALVKIYDLEEEDNCVSVGKPVANVWAYVLDDEGMQLPIGVPGEICISSAYLSPGYYNQPDLTDEFFVRNPNSSCEENEMMYRTGDIGLYNFDGEIEIIGRKDDQLSVRGFRIESGEILSVIRDFPEISDVYLDVDHDNLIAYYVSDDALDIDNLKEALRDELPQYMVPSLFIELDSIPLNPNGKIDKFALRNSFSENSEIDIGDDVLEYVVDAFKEILNLDFALMDDDFVELGGNSLSAMNLQMALNEKLGINLSSSDIIELSSPINIANHIKYNLDVHSLTSLKYGFDDLCPLSESQLNVYLDEMVNDMGTAYNNPFKIDFKDKYSSDEIKGAIGKLLDIYPILSARTINDNETLSFSFDAKPEIGFGSIKDIDSFVKPFDLEKSLSRFLIVVNDDYNSLCIDFHHLVFDGSSGNIVLNSLICLLEGNDVDSVDDGVLRQISFEENISEAYMKKAQEFFDIILADREEAYGLLGSIKRDEGDDAHGLLGSIKTDDGNKGADFEYVDIFEIDNGSLSSFLQNNSLTHNQYFCSVFAYALSRFAGSSKVLFNLIEDGRGHIDLSESVGMFVRTLPLIIDCQNQEISSFLAYSSDAIKSAMKHDLYPYRLLANQYDLNSDILFQYSHDLFSSIYGEDEFGFDVEDLKQEAVGDLAFFIFNIGHDKFGIRILYSEKFSYELIEGFAESYKLILNEMMNAKSLADINYTSSSDLNALDAFNQNERDLDYGDLLDAFNDNLFKSPDNALVSYMDVSYSFGESAFIADKIAKELIGLGVEPQDCVSFLVERSPLYMFCVLGILSVGGIYVPLEDDLPDERIRFMLNDTESRFLIVSDETYERAKALADENAVLLNISKILEEDVGTLSSLPIRYGDLACILYTSGTTGLPKGVKITRKGITSFVDFFVKEFDMGNDARFGMFASIGFDVGAIRGLCWPLYGGFSVDIIPRDIRLDIDSLNSHFIKHGITHITLPTQVARMFIEEIGETSLKVLITGGEKLGEISSSVDYRFIDSYGPTETCVAVCGIDEKEKLDSSSIGHLYANLKAYVLDDEMRPVPIGAVGELCIAGNQVADGYLNRQRETDEAFVKNPFEESEGYDSMYRTGDLVRILPDGSFGIVSRRDNQVKIRGNRVELLEVEAIIREVDCVEDLTVQTIKNGNNNELVAYLLPSYEVDGLRDIVCDYVKRHKPDYMIPSFVVELDRIPLNVNGKVDKSALPEVDLNSLRAEYFAPRNQQEKAIVEAFEKVFNQEKISIRDDFMRLGGDSLTAIKLLSYIESYDITAADILSLRTPEAIAKSIDEIPLDLDIYSVDGGCPLNEAQVNLFADVMLSNKDDIYHIPTFKRIPKRYGLERILYALDETISAHPILAMHLSNRYETKEKKNPLERLRENMDLLKELGDNYDDQSIVDLLRDNGWSIKRIYEMFRIILKVFQGEYPYLIRDSKPPISVESNFNMDSIKEFMTESFDYYNYLSMFKVFELEDHYLLLAKFHHIIFDGVSSKVFKRDFQTFLDGGRVGIDDSFLKMSAFHQQIKNTDKFIEAETFYDNMLRGLGEANDLIGDNQAEGYVMKFYDLDIDDAALKSFLDDAELSENIFFTAAFAYALSRFVDSEKVLFTMVDNGRGRFNDYNSVGLYANVSPLLMDCRNQSIASFMDYSLDMVYGAIKYDYYPILLLYQKYPLDATVIFQYLPDWISYEVIGADKNEEFPSEFMDDFINDFLGNIRDLIAEFVVQVIQKDESYSLMIVNSKNYSEEMVEEFKCTYESIISNLLNADISSDLSGILK